MTYSYLRDQKPQKTAKLYSVLKTIKKTKTYYVTGA